MGKRMSDADFLRELLAYRGTRAGLLLYGWLMSAVVLGCRSEADLLSKAPGGRTTRYKYVNEARDLARHLRRQGWELDPAEVPARLVFDALG